ncbi:Pentatricopeptide repeat-containing protein [Acorus gramineus]|uniref:Pentatricopeptide repeat-containing protein n=1 Tax=Acorus gramineus TaxID=55184 RepID=A0AAV9BAH5_ACOGR|nr:Pentatricopeptide repeat-containing protein [Acorus gramineus]
MDSIKTAFLSPLPPPPLQNPNPRRKPLRIRASSSSWTLSDGNGGGSKPYRGKPRKRPLSDDDARRIIKSKAEYLSCLRRNQGCQAQTPKWIRRTPEQMVRYITDDRDGHMYGKHVIAAIKTVRSLSGRAEGEYDMREVMGSFVMKLTFREMCVVLKEQKGWRQVRDFFSWMKLQLCYRPSVIVYTIVLRMYGQVGKIKLAEEIFLEMLEVGCEPDEVACGTMLCAYARWGRHKDLMLFYSAVRRREILPSVAVFNFMLSSFQKQKLHGDVIELWKEMLDAGVKPNRFTYTVAISSFVREELMEEALHTFYEMKRSRFVPEEATYSLLISLTAKNGNHDEAIKLYEDMRLQDIVPSNYTCASLLSLYYKIGDYSKALSLFMEMEANKIIPDEAIYGILVRIYGKLGLYEDAQRTFDEVESLGLLKDERTYMAMAQVHMNYKNNERALHLLELMKSRNVELSRFAYIALLQCHVANDDVASAEDAFQRLFKTGIPDAASCNDMLSLYVRVGLQEKAKAFIVQVRKDGVQFDEILFRTAINVYSKEGMISDAEKLVEEMENVGLNVDKFIKTSLMAMYAQSGGLKRAEDLFTTLEKPDSTALSVMICLYLSTESDVDTKRTLELLLETSRGLSVASQLINKFAREGDVSKARLLYDHMVEQGHTPEEVAFASLISLYGRTHQLGEAQRILGELSDSPKFGSQIYRSVIESYIKCDEVVEARNLHKEMVGQGHPQDAVTVSMLVNALTRHGKYKDTEDIIHKSFEDDVELDTIAYNTYIKAMLEAGKLHLAADIYTRMLSSGVPPSIQTYNTMISVYGRGGKLDKAVEIFNTAQSLGVLIDEKAYTNMISYYGKAGKSQEASLLFNRMKEEGIRPGKISYDTMVNVYAKVGSHTEAEKLFHDMQRDGHFPDSFTYLALIRAYIESKNYPKAEEIIIEMEEEGICPSAHYNLLVLSLAKAGLVMEAGRIYTKIKQMGLSPDLPCCRNLMRAYMDYGLIDEGISLFEQINGTMKPDSFVLSAAVHLYESANKKCEASEVLDLMNKEGVMFLSNLRVGKKVQGD